MSNQIIQIRKKEIKKIRVLQIQIFFSLLGIISILVFLKLSQNNSLNYENYSKILAQSSVISSVYQTDKNDNSNIFGTLEIPSLNISYAVFNEFNEDLLNISPCKFYGVDLAEIGNIAIAGHNFDNHTFFSDLNKLKIGDEIHLFSNSNKKYIYSIYTTFETNSDDLDVLKSKFLTSKELTLITCNNSNKKRFIVKAFLKN